MKESVAGLVAIDSPQGWWVGLSPHQVFMSKIWVFLGVFLAPTVKELWKSDTNDHNQSCQKASKTPPC